jgi:hypothetical protein
MRGSISRLLAAPLISVLLAIAACGGSAVVTLTATPSSDSFITYRVGLASIRLQTSSGKAGATVLPTETMVDFTKLLDLSEVVGAPAVAKGTYTGALITFDYSTAVIIYDDGSLDGVELTPLDANGKALGLVSVQVTLDPSDPLLSAPKQVGLMALDFNLAASNIVNLSARTVTITPMLAASMLPIDAKQVRIRGPLLGSSGTFFATGVTPFDNSVAGLGQLSITSSDATTYELNGFVSTGSAGQAQLAALPTHTLTSAFGTLTAANSASIPVTPAASTTSTTPATPAASVTTLPTTNTITSSVSFAASQVLVDSSVQGLGLARLSGVVSARSGNTLGIEDATLVQDDGTNTFLPGTTIVNVGANTLVTFFGQSVTEVISPDQISVGSLIDVLGTVGNTSAGGTLIDASAGHVRLDLTTASGLVTAQGSSALTLNLTNLGGRAIESFDFVGSGAAANQYAVATPSLDLTNAVVAAPVVVTGFSNAFGTAPPNFTASTLFDPTTIQAELVIDWSGGTAAPFTTFDGSAITLDVHNTGIGPRHQIQIGSQIINLTGLSSDPTIAPNSTGSATLFAIGHAASFTIESFNTYDAFITQLQTELTGATLATGMTAVGQYTVSTFAFAATSITLVLNN